METTTTVTRTYLYITVSHKTAEEMADHFNFNADQRQQLSELLAEENHRLWSAVLYGIYSRDDAIVKVALSQVGNVGGEPYWSWYGFNSRVEWCACFVSWCYGQSGRTEPRFAGCQSQGVPWFQSHGQWGARGYENIAPGDAIFFDWDLDGSADHVGIVVGTDGSRVYTVEGNSGDACKIKSYDLNYQSIKGYGLMNW